MVGFEHEKLEVVQENVSFFVTIKHAQFPLVGNRGRH